VQRNAPEAYREQMEVGDAEHVLREAAAIESPTQRFQQVGAQNLSIVELLSIVLDEQTPVLASRILTQLPTLPQIACATPGLLQAIKGMTPRRVMHLQSALQLAYRPSPTGEKRIIKCPQDCATLFGAEMQGLEQEQMRVVILDTKNRVKSVVTAYQGSLHTTVIRVAELFREAMIANAAAVIVMHNHPSGDATPSPEDIAVTREIAQAGKLLDIDVLDHLVIGNPGFVSLKERGLGFG
jgi:DNA repair protein RadC